MSGAILVRNDWFEVVHGTYDASTWTGDHYIGHLTPMGDPSGAVYRTGTSRGRSISTMVISYGWP
eukprot:929355-Lingulodinium_polyedra.AAC.1